MRTFLAALLTLLTLSAAASADCPEPQDLDWKPWRSMAVQDGGRQKPLDSLAWETLRMISNRASFTDPETRQKLDATGLYLSMVFDWQKGEQAANPHGAHGSISMDSRAAYFSGREPDKWDRMPLIVVDFLELREALGMAADQKYISPLELNQAEIQDPHTQTKTRFGVFVQRLTCRQGEQLSAFEKKSLELATRLWAYQEHRMGRKLEVAPLPENEDRQWASIAYLIRGDLDDRLDPGGKLRQVKELFQKARSAYRANAAEDFQEASAHFLTTLREVGPQLGPYPPQATIDLEVAYNHWVPFRFAWVLMLIACLCTLLSMGSGWKSFYVATMLSFGAGLAAMFIGFAMRCAISGRAPVTNMYESVIYVGLGVAVLGLVLELIYHRQLILVAAAAISTLALILADNCPALLDPNLQPLQPVLRNNFWLVTHVMTITLSYAAFALALGIGNISLGYHLIGSANQAAIDALDRFMYRTLQVGVFLLAVGTVLGGVWADYSWGRFWGWDPKEVWALIALLGYLAVLHARTVGWVAQLGLAALSVACFSLVIVAWYGVNFMMGTGLHNYGFSGNGGQAYVGGALVLQFVYVMAAILRGAR
jgi:cytochrome c-type biogenesis protein CcsB